MWLPGSQGAVPIGLEAASLTACLHVALEVTVAEGSVVASPNSIHYRRDNREIDQDGQQILDNCRQWPTAESRVQIEMLKQPR